MAKQKQETIRNMTDAELEQNVHTAREELYKFRFEATSGRVEKPHKIRAAKRTIARCLTVMKERSRGK